MYKKISIHTKTAWNKRRYLPSGIPTPPTHYATVPAMLLVCAAIILCRFWGSKVRKLCLWCTSTRKHRRESSPVIVAPSATKITFEVCGRPRLLFGTWTPSCLNLPRPSSYAIPMRWAFSEFCSKALLNSNAFEQIPKHTTLFLVF